MKEAYCGTLGKRPSLPTVHKQASVLNKLRVIAAALCLQGQVSSNSVLLLSSLPCAVTVLVLLTPHHAGQCCSMSCPRQSIMPLSGPGQPGCMVSRQQCCVTRNPTQQLSRQCRQYHWDQIQHDPSSRTCAKVDWHVCLHAIGCVLLQAQPQTSSNRRHAQGCSHQNGYLACHHVISWCGC